MTIKPRCMATAIGSMPHDNPAKAVDFMLSTLTESPVWPQLPIRSLNEQMEIQYSEGMPCAVIEREKRRMFFDTSADYSESFALFFENYMSSMDPETGSGDCSCMAISPDFSKGIYALEERLKADKKTYPFIKVQTTGPCSFALTIVDEKKRAIYYNEEFRDMIVKALAMKCRWQIQRFKPYAKNVICFVDEPILSAFGSSTYVSVKREDVVSHLNEMIRAIHADGAFSGIHCCGNTEWSILIDAGVDIVNFDAFEFGETIAIYAGAVKKFLEKGGVLAWGVVPTSVLIREQTVDSLISKFESVAANLASKGIDLNQIREQAIITPSCGTGSMKVEDAEKVFLLLGELSKALKKRYNF